jgi:membrane-associated phospholipid phosphatase
MRKPIFILMSLFVVASASAQDSISVKNIKHAIGQTFIYKKDTLYFGKPRILNNIAHVPASMWQIAKSPLQKKNWIGLGIVASTTAILIAKDPAITKWVMKTSDAIGIVRQTNYLIPLKIGNTKVIKLPRNINTALYQLGQGGTSMMLAGGLWIYGKIGKDLRAVNTANDLAETFITMGLTTQILKRATGRESPFLATRPGGKWTPFPAFAEYQRNTSAYDGFPSGHLATLMATITVLSSNYPEKKWIKPVGYSLMGVSAWVMANIKVHWVGDYPLAIAIGYLSGKITTWGHRQSNKHFIKAIPL